VFKLPVGVNVMVVGLYSSAVARAFPLMSDPPATRTDPLFKRVTVFWTRPVFRLPVAVKVPDPTLYNSALARTLPFAPPPKISTVPLFKSAAVCRPRAVFKLPVPVNDCVAAL
jgi:hypothetical protein